MRKLNPLFFCIISALISTGCSSLPTPPVYSTVVISPPDNLLLDCSYTPPPNKKLYLEAEWEEKERLLTEMNLLQIKNLAICNSRLSGLRDWKQKQSELYQGSK